MAKPNKYFYRIVFQIQQPKGKWKDLKFYDTDSSFFISSMNQEFISQTKREVKYDLPRYKTRIIKRRVLRENLKKTL